MVTVITNHVPRDTIQAFELSAAEREEFDYLDWKAIEEGRDSAEFVRYKSELYDLGEFSRAGNAEFNKWDGIMSDTFFSGILVKYVFEGEIYQDAVVMGRYYS